MAKSKASREATIKYDAKTYRLIGIRFRKDEDSDILKDFDSAKGNGISNREWVRGLYEKAVTKA